jgi:hypothetical protein
VTYAEWIAARYPDTASARACCAEATRKLVAAFPELRRVRGHYVCPLWGPREHWWCVAPDGSVVDPTQAQFPTRGGFEYEERDETRPEPTGRCHNCGEYCYGGRTDTCSAACHETYRAYLMDLLRLRQLRRRLRTARADG